MFKKCVLVYYVQEACARGTGFKINQNGTRLLVLNILKNGRAAFKPNPGGKMKEPSVRDSSLLGDEMERSENKNITD